MSLETESAKIKPDLHDHKFGRDSANTAGALSSSVWDDMKLASLPKPSESTARALTFDNAFSNLNATLPKPKFEYATPGQIQPTAKPEVTQTHKNPDGGHTDTTTGATGSTDSSTYNEGGKLVAKHTQNPDGTYLDWKVDGKGHVSIHEKKSDGSLRTRDEYQNGNFKEEIKYKDGKKSSSSHFADSQGGYVDDATNKDGSEKLTQIDQSGKPVFKYDKKSDGSYSERKLNPDNSVFFHDQKADGSYTESTTDKKGTSRTIHTVNKADGSSETKSYDPAGDLSGERKTKRDKSFVETTYNPDHTRTVHEQAADGKYAEAYLNSKNERVSPTIVVVKASPEFAQKVKDEIANLPEPIKKLLAKNDSVIAIGGKLSDIDPSEAKLRPRGYEKGQTGDNAGGVEEPYTGKDGKRHEIAIVAENTLTGKTDDIEGTVRHEVGHAIDALLKDYSHSPEFKAAYDKDVAAMSKETKKDEEYFLQKGHLGNDGREEAFAEVVRAVTGDPSEARNAEVLKLFPEAAELVKKKLSELPQ